jgi:trehalose 6-phosphate phosphatase
MSNVIPPLPNDFEELALLLDVDGTLLDLAPTPREVFVPHSLREALAWLWDRTSGGVAFVSGRPIGELDLLFTPLQLPAVGGHGAEIRAVAAAAPERPRFPPLDSTLKRKLAAIAEQGPGIIVEDKGYSLALHYRLAPEKEAAVRAAAAAICASSAVQSLELLPGKLMIEIKQGGFGKGSGVRELMSYQPFAGRRPIFVGDDLTDESVFAIMPEYQGIAASVGRKLPNVEYHFDAPADVRQWLERVSRLEKTPVS